MKEMMHAFSDIFAREKNSMHINMLVNMNPLGRPLGRFRKETVAVSGHSDRDYRSHVRQGRSCADGIGRRAELSH